jgi:hypothetical protein
MRTFIRALLDAEDAYASAASAAAEYAAEKPALFCLWVFIALNVAVALLDITCIGLRTVRSLVCAVARAQRRILAFCLRPALFAALTAVIYANLDSLLLLREVIGV